MSLIRTRAAGESWARFAQRALHEHRYPLPTLRPTRRQLHPPTIYYCAPDYDVPTGGIRVAYRHVDLLNEAGMRAAVLHRRPNFRCRWFENHTHVEASRHTTIGPQDLVVVGELAADLLLDLPPGYRFVVFNQNPHLTWRRVSEAAAGRYAGSPDLAAILTVSDHSADLLRYAMPTANVVRLHNSVDPRLFAPTPDQRPLAIAYMPRRGRDEAQQVLGILHCRGALSGWDVTPLEHLSEREVAAGLRSTRIFLSLAYHEGFGLPAAEAMACGCYVVGFHGFAGREFFRPEFSSPVAPGDVLAFAQAVENAVERDALDPGWCAARGAEAAAFIAREYSPDRERHEVISTYAALMSGGPSQRAESVEFAAPSELIAARAV
jgi:glycosyltransferase involved in cell wall biosynthesis